MKVKLRQPEFERPKLFVLPLSEFSAPSFRVAVRKLRPTKRTFKPNSGHAQ
jgi:hypothetical protein